VEILQAIAPPAPLLRDSAPSSTGHLPYNTTIREDKRRGSGTAVPGENEKWRRTIGFRAPMIPVHHKTMHRIVS